ncbi:MAG: class I SAM-dependent methyltransferase [Candidatus Pedobacter colombiensis]|uniref:Class I SAM-dependent methyltransferase n=1 Tax=Candidatus Pedobacter colombiensis TaxID=3121371 RepID=A0AAJ6B6X8_9SPHI|nr:class I SAM-dependent methyltransferase [Pedobacter sp.]WEK19665.1 MAG: class I SAM-dependent methyltransferase [Pedobacter sp.]
MKVTEEEIRPEKIFAEYLELTNKDVVTYFSNVPTSEIVCPACGGTGKIWATKSGFSYRECNDCISIYVSPRPARDAFDAYYTDSPSTKYWATTFYKVTEAARREKLWKPKAQMVKDIIEKNQVSSKINTVIDIGGGYGVFDEELKKIMNINAIVIEPSMHLAQICRDKGLVVIEKFMEDILPNELPDGRKCFVSFELFEHLYDPEVFLKNVLEGMQKDDLFIFTTLSGMGLDIQILGEHAKAISPPHHLNFLNPKSVSKLLEKVGFNVLEAKTPGKLDVDILKNNTQFIKDNFWQNYFKYATQDEQDEMQLFIANAGLSSHMMITCKKP